MTVKEENVTYVANILKSRHFRKKFVSVCNGSLCLVEKPTSGIVGIQKFSLSYTDGTERILAQPSGWILSVDQVTGFTRFLKNISTFEDRENVEVRAIFITRKKMKRLICYRLYHWAVQCKRINFLRRFCPLFCVAQLLFPAWVGIYPFLLTHTHVYWHCKRGFVFFLFQRQDMANYFFGFSITYLADAGFNFKRNTSCCVRIVKS